MTDQTVAPCILYIVRHGQTSANASDIIQGTLDLALTDKGVSQAQAIAKKFRDVKFDAAFSSDLIRAHRTAEILALDHKLIVTTNKLLREKHFGKYEGVAADIYRTELKDALAEMESLSEEEQMTYKTASDIESDSEILTRLLTFLRETSVAYLGKTVLIVCHGAIMRTLLLRLGYCSRKQLAPKLIDNLGYVIIESDGSDFIIKETHGVHVTPVSTAG